MYLSNRDIKWAIDSKKLIVEPPPSDGFDETSIDLHLDDLKFAKVGDVEKMKKADLSGNKEGALLHLGTFVWERFSPEYLVVVPDETEPPAEKLVYRKGGAVHVRPGGFLLWTTKEWVGTPKDNPELISFVNAKSTKARTGLLVHFTAPTIHAGWEGNITLEIANLGPFVFVLKPGDAIAQLTVATISSRPDPSLKKQKSATYGQTGPEAPKRK